MGSRWGSVWVLEGVGTEVAFIDGIKVWVGVGFGVGVG